MPDKFIILNVDQLDLDAELLAMLPDSDASARVVVVVYPDRKLIMQGPAKKKTEPEPLKDKPKTGSCRFCGEQTTGRYEFMWICDSQGCNKELEQYERERLEQAREAAERDAFGRYY